ncbi:hypothetical protein AVEN_233258-1 [Araneus ventricosus]|uniref:Uncharacterized protein n=1 Tax=Araneus ventricosus TaxID=182803 RepID=A0A4Y2RVK1_ARAVE|nr:hypothetical protein AVEN_233258-1 [Araneus ventricosus]
MPRVTLLVCVLLVSVQLPTSFCRPAMQKRSAGPFPSRNFPGGFNTGNSGIVNHVVGLVGDTVGNLGKGISSIGHAAGGIVNGLTRRLG